MSGQLCIPNGETCVDCTGYAAAFSCLPKVKISDIAELSKLDTVTALNSKCGDIIFPVTVKNCEEGFSSFSLSIKQLLDISSHTSIGERKSFPNIAFKNEGEFVEYELTVFNPHETRDMQMSYFFTWNTTFYSKLYPPAIKGESFVDNEIIGDQTSSADVFGTKNTNWVYVNGLAGTTYYTKVVGPKEYTTAKIKLTAQALNRGGVEDETASADSIQLMITGVTK